MYTQIPDARTRVRGPTSRREPGDIELIETAPKLPGHLDPALLSRAGRLARWPMVRWELDGIGR
jgi:hypothetical protein